jgi:hypothetical protein
MHIKVETKSNSEFQSLTFESNSESPPQIQIDVLDAYEIKFGRSTYAQKENNITFLVASVPGPTKIGFEQNVSNNFNIQSPIGPGAIHIKIDAQVTYDTQLGHFWTPWKVKEITFPMKLVLCTNSIGINRNHKNNWTSRIYLGVVPLFLAFGPRIVSSPIGLCLGGTCMTLEPL